MRVIVPLMLLCLTGCKTSSPGPEFPGLDESRFERSVDMRQPKTTAFRPVTIRFDDTPFVQGMSALSEISGLPITYAQTFEDRTLNGVFINQPLPAILESIARRVDGSVTFINGIYFIGQTNAGNDSGVCAVIRIPPTGKEELMAAVQTTATSGKVALIGSCLWINDSLETIRKIQSAVEMVRDRSDRSYIAEVFFIRTSEDRFIKLTGDLQIRQIDVFSSAFNIEELFQMFVDADAKDGVTKIEQRPVLYVSEGRKVTFSDGNEITREQKSVTENGVIETTGYAKFSDGLHLDLTLNRVSEKSYMLDIDLSISVFDSADKNLIPGQKRSALKTPGLLVQDGKTHYVGSLKRSSDSRSFGLLSWDTGRNSDFLTIWVRVRESRP